MFHIFIDIQDEIFEKQHFKYNFLAATPSVQAPLTFGVLFR